MGVIALGFLYVELFVDMVQCQSNQAVEWHSICQNCQMEHCDVCAIAGKTSCDTCSLGYYFEAESGICEDSSCRMKHCEQCSESGIWGCDKCEDGYYVN